MQHSFWKGGKLLKRKTEWFHTHQDHNLIIPQQMLKCTRNRFEHGRIKYSGSFWDFNLSVSFLFSVSLKTISHLPLWLSEGFFFRKTWLKARRNKTSTTSLEWERIESSSWWWWRAPNQRCDEWRSSLLTAKHCFSLERSGAARLLSWNMLRRSLVARVLHNSWKFSWVTRPTPR